MLEQTLQQIGLTEKQAKIYLACLELGECSIKEIARKAELKRTTIYDIIDDMIKAGFIKTIMQGKKKKYLAAEPSELESIIKKREILLAQILPQLNSLNNSGGTKPKVWFYEGKEGLKKAYADTLKYNGELLSFASEHVAHILGKNWVENYFRKRIKRKIHVRAIMPSAEYLTKEIISRDRKQLRMTKTINPNKYLFSIEINLYGHRKVAFMSSKEETALVIEAPEIYNTLKLIFEFFWDTLPEVGLDKSIAKKPTVL